MKTFRVVIALAAIFCVASVHVEALAKDRNCTAAEKMQADKRLDEIGADKTLRNKLIKWHMAFGVHKATVPTDNEEILVQYGYVMDHDGDLRTSLWVSYRLTAKNMIDAQGKQRVNCFRRDPRRGSSVAAVVSDYDEPQYDLGHMANDADLKYDLITELNSYILSNMSPQECRFNRGIWLSLEELTRMWATKYDTIYITSGAIFDRDNNGVRDADADAMRMHSRNGKSRVAVPNSDQFLFFSTTQMQNMASNGGRSALPPKPRSNRSN
jgi:endonuclease G